jgi:protein TonB
MPVAQIPPIPLPSPVVPQDAMLSSLFGERYGVYRARTGAFVLSYLANFVAAVLLVWSGHWFVQHRQEIKQQVVGLVTDVSPYVLPSSKTQAGGGGGGGDRDKMAASKGSPLKFAREQIAPPLVVVRNENPKLPVAPAVVGPPQIQLPQLGVLGDPLSSVLGPPSSGTE